MPDIDSLQSKIDPIKIQNYESNKGSTYQSSYAYWNEVNTILQNIQNNEQQNNAFDKIQNAVIDKD